MRQGSPPPPITPQTALQRPAIAAVARPPLHATHTATRPGMPSPATLRRRQRYTFILVSAGRGTAKKGASVVRLVHRATSSTARAGTGPRPCRDGGADGGEAQVRELGHIAQVKRLQCWHAHPTHNETVQHAQTCTLEAVQAWHVAQVQAREHRQPRPRQPLQRSQNTILA